MRLFAEAQIFVGRYCRHLYQDEPVGTKKLYRWLTKKRASSLGVREGTCIQMHVTALSLGAVLVLVGFLGFWYYGHTVAPGVECIEFSDFRRLQSL